jgi:1-acyl-sn-glycerol-3-phosphate acyltransferase
MTSRARARELHPSVASLPLRIARRIANRVVRTVFRMRVTGMANLPARGPVLLAGNHSGFLDGPLVYMVLARHAAFLVKSELERGPFRRVLNFAMQIPVHRGTPDRTALQAGLAVLRDGGVLGMFPEGTRGKGGLVAIQHGIGYLALHGNVPIVPVVCRGTAEALPKGRYLPHWRAPIDIVIGEAFVLDVPGDPRARSTVAAATEQVRQRLLAHLTVVSGEPVAPDPTGTAA